MEIKRVRKRRDACRPGDVERSGPKQPKLVPLAARRWIYVGACLLVALGGLVSLVACGRTPQEAEPGPSATEIAQEGDPQPTETRSTPQDTLPSPEPTATQDKGDLQPTKTHPPPQGTPTGSNVTGDVGGHDYWPTESWRTSSPEEQGMDSSRLEEMMALVDENDIAIDSAIVVRHGYIVFEEYRNYYGQNSKHHIQSVTKSFTSMLIGIAIQQGLIRDVEQKMVEFFPDHTIQNMDTRKENITLENLLTMSDGMDWHELDYPYDDPRNTLGQMWVSRDAVQHILDRPMARDPGARWAYNSGTSILLGGILEQVTKRDVLDFAQDYLFGPIGIDDVRWAQTTGGHYHTDGGLWLTPRDMARFGYLMLNEGTWDGQQIVSPEWVQQSTTPHYQTPWGYGYGYQWWTLSDVEAYAATGHYEQKIYVVPRADLVAVFTADIADEDPHPTDSFLERYIVPACTDLPAVQAMDTYAKYGFAFEYPLGASLLEAPIPGRDTISDESGMVQFNSLYPPLEVVNIIWDRAEHNVDARQLLEEFMASVGQETGIEYDWGQSSEGKAGNHDLVLQFFRTTADGFPFSGVMGLWHCAEANRVYLLTYAVTPEMADEDVLAAFQQHLNSLACHETD